MKIPILRSTLGGPGAFRPKRAGSNAAWRRFGGYLLAVAIVIAMVGIAFLLHQILPHANLSLLFLTGVLLVSATTGLGPSMLAGLLSFMAFNFLFTTPYYTLAVADQGDLATLAFFLLMAAVTGNLAATMRRESHRRQTSLRRISKLYEFSNQTACLLSAEEILEALREHLERCLERPVRIVRDEAAPAADGFVHLELIINGRTLGVAEFRGEADFEQMEIARSLCEQAAVALDRTRLVEELEASRLVSETEQLRSALLSSVSHDLRTPLAAIIGSSSSLQEYGDSFSDADRKELLSTVLSEAQRLDRYIQNLLDMTRLGHGKLTLRRDWVDVRDLVASAAARLEGGSQDVTVKTQVKDALPLLWVHGVLIEQALFNLIDNAVRFSPPGGCVEVVASGNGESVEITVTDAGPGIPEAEREKVFDMFYTVRGGDRSPSQGTGLGLAICRGMVAAHGGSVMAGAGSNGRGTCMCMCLPLHSTGAKA